jgi:hypothetical protein
MTMILGKAIFGVKMEKFPQQRAVQMAVIATTLNM